jgi:hypothetical protein
MAITLSNGVNNVNATPGINSNTFANRPAATDVAVGSIYIATDTGQIFQSNGAAWITLGGGGGPTPTPGIDDVLSVNQPLSVAQVIEMAGNNFSFQDGFLNAIQFFPDGDFQFGKSGDTKFIFTIVPGASQFYLQEPAGTNHLNIDCGTKFYQFGDFLGQGNGNSLQMSDNTELIEFTNKGFVNGIKLDFALQAYYFGRLNVGTEKGMLIDEANNQIYFLDNGNIQGLLLDFSSTTYRFGGIDSSVNPDLFLNVNQNNGNIFVQYSGNDNGFLCDFSANKRFALGDYQGVFNSTHINIDDSSNIIQLLNSTSAGYIEFQANSFRIQGANLQTGSSSGPSGQFLIIDLNGATFHIPLDNP